MNNSTDVLHVVENGVELFTIVSTGESGMSQRGLARACGKRVSTIQNLIKNLTDKAPSKTLKHWIGKALTLTDETIKRNGKEITVYHADFCSDAITHYAFLGSETAQDIVAATNKIGLNSFIQAKTGWLPEEYQSSQESREAVNRILLENAPYNALYQKDVCDRAFSWFGCQFYWSYFYFWMSTQERCDLDKRNPPVNGRRKTCIHQWIEGDTKERLRDKAIALGTLILAARSRSHFIELFQNRYGDGWQMDMFE